MSPDSFRVTPTEMDPVECAIDRLDFITAGMIYESFRDAMTDNLPLGTTTEENYYAQLLGRTEKQDRKSVV